ncbi:DUF7935 family protein [Pontibacter arcticus]|uniref:Uncharacterized protein n=1 Tax=Pontibacter arcticus TaxID=2080288 RepID=A0A364RD85_9BACT|nr:hypothetical protein [Pontibacter arcticus]RAU82234.1 hypothetical protein DP923_10595 [Pontibacter arcticus]
MEGTISLILDLIKFALPALILVGGLNFLLQKHYEREDRLRASQPEGKQSDGLLSIRLQAYERIVLLLERITPNNLLLRVGSSGLTAPEYHSVLLSEIRNEFNHNMSQQVYMSEAAWQQVTHAREDVVNLINRKYQEMPEGARGTDLAKRILEHLLTQQTDPTSKALSYVKQEIAQLF